MGQAVPSDNLRGSGPGTGKAGPTHSVLGSGPGTSQVGTTHYVWGSEAGTGQEGPTYYFRSSVSGSGQAGPALEKVIPQLPSHFITSYSEPQQYRTEMVTEPQYYLVTSYLVFWIWTQTSTVLVLLQEKDIFHHLCPSA